MGQNVNAAKGLSFPAELPVLAFLAQDTIDILPEWYPAHQEQLKGPVCSKLIVLDDATTCTTTTRPRSPTQPAPASEVSDERHRHPRARS